MKVNLDTVIDLQGQSLTVRQLIVNNPSYIYKRYITEIDFDLNLDIIWAMEQRRFNMRKAYIKRLLLIAAEIQ